MITVLAGVNGAGKSSIGGSALRAAGRDWYNPNEIAAEMLARFPDKPRGEINSRVWFEGRRRLEAAIRERHHFAFETTLGGNSITHSLLDAIAAGVPVSIWYCGLATPEQHLERVASRVARGGHDIPEALVRSRFQTSMRNLCRLAPGLHQLAVYDNSAPLDKHGRPAIRCLLHLVDGEIRRLQQPMPDWAKPVATVCLGVAARRGSERDDPQP